MNDELIAYYVNLLIVQYHDKTKAKATIQAFASALMIYDLIIAVRDGFDIGTAIGAQLDILGEYIGHSRIITGTDYEKTYFGYAKYGDVSPFTFDVYIKYGDTVPDEKFLRYEESNQSLYSLSDEEYRKFLKQKIIINNGSTPSLKIIDDMLYTFFGSLANATDNLNSTITYSFDSSLERWATILKDADLLPRPAGCRIEIEFV